MRNILSTVFVVSFISFKVFSQTPIDVIESTLKVSGFGEEVFYYGFAEGDQLIFNFEEVNKKELKELEIIELPSSSKFMDYKTKKVDNKVLNINRTGIYKFRFANSALGGRICKFKIQRIPASEATKNFNTSVFWRTVHDTIFRDEQEKYLVKKEYKPVEVLGKTEYYINSSTNIGGRTRITFPVNLPQNTVEWYYTFSASRNKETVSSTKKSITLFAELTKLIDQTGALNFGVDMLTKPPGGNICDIFLLDFNNRGLFEAKGEFKYYLEGSRENLVSGVVKIKSIRTPNIYLGVRNPDMSYGINVVVEVAAITLEEEWSTRNVRKYDVTSKEQPYLKN